MMKHYKFRLAFFWGSILFFASCGCTRYYVRSNKLISSGDLFMFALHEVKTSVNDTANYHWSPSLQTYLTDSNCIIKANINSRHTRKFRLREANPHFTCTLYTSSDTLVIENMSLYVRPGKKYVITGLMRGHCPPEHIYFKTNKKGRIRKS
jgi:hypothetical protein